MPTLLQEQSFDTATADAFAERVSGMLNAGAATIMLSVGYRSYAYS